MTRRRLVEGVLGDEEAAVLAFVRHVRPRAKFEESRQVVQGHEEQNGRDVISGFHIVSKVEERFAHGQVSAKQDAQK